MITWEAPAAQRIERGQPPSLRAEVYDYIRTLVHAELDEQKNRQRIEQLAMKIRGQLDQLNATKMGRVRKAIGARF